VAIDTATHDLTERTESMHVSWFANGGHFDTDQTGRAETETKEGSTFTDNGFTAPTAPGTAQLWTVLRDDRGGTAWEAFALTIEPQ
jgi:hypothetical protein